MGLDVTALRESFGIVVEVEPRLAARFYDRLFTQYPGVKPLFSGRTDVEQQRMLTEMLVLVLEQVDRPSALESTLRALGERHQGYGVTAEMFPWVGACLLETLAEVAGPRWEARYEQAWAGAFQAIAGLMLSGYASNPTA